MDLINILAFDISGITESATALWAIIGTLGAGTVVNVLVFFKTSVSGKKFTKVADFAVVADQSIKFAKDEFTVLKEQIVDEVKKQIVGPLTEQVSALLSDNAQLASITVSLLSYIPLPLEVKKDAVAIFSKLGNITDKAKALIESSVAYQEKQDAILIETDTKLKDTIDKI